MIVIEQIKKEILGLLEGVVGKEVELLEDQLGRPPKPEMGDFCFPCFALAGVMKKSPAAVADDIAGILRHKIENERPKFVESVKNVGPYVNFTVNVVKILAKSDFVIHKQNTKHNGRKIIVEYGQPNTHKEFHVGHLRNALVGRAVVELLAATGSRVVPVSYIGDTGAHVAKCLWALQKFHGREKPPAAHRGEWLGKIYSEAAQKLEERKEWEEDVRLVDRKLGGGDRTLVGLWKKTRAWSLAEFRQIFKELGASFKKTYYESQVEKPGQKVVDDLVRRKVAAIKDGAAMVDLIAEKLDEFVLRRKDGTALYATKDLALAYQKHKDWHPDESLIVVDIRQSFYFKQLIRTLELAGFKEKMRALLYEFVTLPEGAMASRKGNVVTYRALRDAAVEEARTETKKRHPDWPTVRIEKAARAIAFAAIRYEMLRYDLDRPITFDLKQALAFQGATGPYLLYTLARINGIVKKVKSNVGAGFSLPSVEGGLKAAPTLADEKGLALEIVRYPEVVAEAVRTVRPSVVAAYLMELAQAFAAFYENVPVLKAEPPDRVRRFKLIRAAGATMTAGLRVLGISPVREM